MVTEHFIEGYDNFKNFMKELDSQGKPIYVYFSGSKLPSGESWCDDCQRAKPIVEQSLKMLDTDSYFIYVEVGDRAFWKDMQNPFRMDPKLRLMVIPTLIRWMGPQRLEGEQCEKQELVEMLLTDEDE